MAHGGAAFTGELPCGDVLEVRVVAPGLAVGVLELLSEVAAAALAALEGVAAEQLAELQEVRDATRLFERDVERFVFARDVHVLPEILAQRRDLAQRLLQALLGARHAAVVPHDPPELAVVVIHAALALDPEHALRVRAHGGLGLRKLRAIRGRALADLGREVVADGVWQHEVAVGEALHERARAEAVRAVVAEVRFAEHEQAGHIRHEVVVHPQPAHRVMHGGIDAHRHLVGVLVGDLFVDLEEVAVTLPHLVLAQPLDGIREVQIYAQPAGADASPVVACLLRRARGDVARREVAEARVFPFEIVVALRLGDRIRRARVALLLGNPDAPVVAQRFAHQRELRLILAGDRDAGRVDLRVAGVRKERAALIGAIRGGHVAALRVRREVEDVAVAARREHHAVGRIGADRAGDHVAHHDALRMALDHHHIEHLRAREHLHRPLRDLPVERGIRADQELLAGLPARVKRARHLRATEGPVREQSAVFARERNALRHALVDDRRAHLREPMHVCLARPEVAALDRVVKQPVHRVAVVLVILRRIDAALRRDRMRAPRRVLVAEALHRVAHLSERRRGARASQTRADHDDLVFAPVRGVDELRRELVALPLLRERAGGDFGIDDNAHFKTPVRTAIGIET